VLTIPRKLVFHSIALTFFLILFYQLLVRLPTAPFRSGFPTKTLHAVLFSHICTKCSDLLILLDINIRKITQEIINFGGLHYVVLSLVLGPSFFPSSPLLCTISTG